MKNQPGNNLIPQELELLSGKRPLPNSAKSILCIRRAEEDFQEILITCSPLKDLSRQNISEARNAREFHSSFCSLSSEQEWLSKISRRLSLRTSLSQDTLRELSFSMYYSSEFFRHLKAFRLFPHKLFDTIVYTYNLAYNFFFTKILNKL